MQDQRACLKCGMQIPVVIKLQGRNRNLQRRKYCLQCSPFGKHNTVALHIPRQIGTITSITCRLCDRPIKNNSANRTRCMSCNTKIRRIRAKMAAVKLLGGKCQECGFSGHLAAFEFHHISGKKEFAIGNVSNKSWPVIRRELKKCKLLCSNCHRISHASELNERLLAQVAEYKGKVLEP